MTREFGVSCDSGSRRLCTYSRSTIVECAPMFPLYYFLSFAPTGAWEFVCVFSCSQMSDET